MAFSSSTLALLTALFAVSGLVFPALHDFLVPTSVSFLGTTEDDHLLVLITNRTDGEVYLERAELGGKLLSRGPFPLRPVGEDGGFVDRDSIPFSPGSSTSVRLRPEDSLDLDGDPEASTAFTLRVGVRPSRAWSRTESELRGIRDFVCTWDRERSCDPEPETTEGGDGG